jgi:hypothetical protein
VPLLGTSYSSIACSCPWVRSAPDRSPPLRSCSCAHTPTLPASTPCLPHRPFLRRARSLRAANARLHWLNALAHFALRQRPSLMPVPLASHPAPHLHMLLLYRASAACTPSCSCSRQHHPLGSCALPASTALPPAPPARIPRLPVPRRVRAQRRADLGPPAPALCLGRCRRSGPTPALAVPAPAPPRPRTRPRAPRQRAPAPRTTYGRRSPAPGPRSVPGPRHRLPREPTEPAPSLARAARSLLPPAAPPGAAFSAPSRPLRPLPQRASSRASSSHARAARAPGCRIPNAREWKREMGSNG